MPTHIPSDYGNIGDYYIDVDTGNFYGPKTSSGWPDSPFFTALSSSNLQNERLVFSQPSASSSWVITHELGGHPSVTIVDSAGTQVIGEVKYDSETQITVTFTAAFSGFAYLT